MGKRAPRIRAIVVVALATIGIAGVVGALFGHLAHNQTTTFDWNVAAVAATAFATVALAGGTFVLASATLQDAGASRELALLARKDQWDRDRPNIVILDYDLLSPDPAEDREVPIARIKYANVGLAPAINVTFRLVWYDSHDEPVVMSEQLKTRQLTWPSERGSIDGVLLVRGNYGDRERTEISVNAVDRRGRGSSAMWVADRDGDFYLGSSEFEEL